MSLLLVLPIAVPLASAGLGMLLRGPRARQAVAISGGVALLGCAIALVVRVLETGALATQVGGWPAPFGISLVADLLSAVMTLVAALVGLCVLVYSASAIDEERKAHGFYALLQVLLAGVCGAFLAGDLFNLYVWFETMLIASFVLLSLGGDRAQLEGAVKYVSLNLLASALFLAAAGLLYGMLGTLNLADLSQKLRHSAQPGVSLAAATLLLGAFAIKAAVFPVFFWLPPAYPAAPVAIVAAFAGLLTKVGVYALIRVMTLLFSHQPGFTPGLLLGIAALTMVTGVLGAAAGSDFRRILSLHIISQIGYTVMGLGLFSALGLAGGVFFLVHNVLAKTNLFLVSGMAARVGGGYDLRESGGLYRSRPLLALLFLVPALALAGMPPLSGFFGKLALIRAGLEAGQYAVVATAAGVSLLTLFSMTKIWAAVFWKPSSLASAPTGRLPLTMLAPSVLLALLTILLGVFASPAMALSTRIAGQLLTNEAYFAAVSGEGR